MSQLKAPAFQAKRPLIQPQAGQPQPAQSQQKTDKGIVSPRTATPQAAQPKAPAPSPQQSVQLRPDQKPPTPSEIRQSNAANPAPSPSVVPSVPPVQKDEQTEPSPQDEVSLDQGSHTLANHGEPEPEAHGEALPDGLALTVAQTPGGLREAYKEDYYENGIPIGMENMEATDLVAAEWRIVQRTSSDILKEFPGSVGSLYRSPSNDPITKSVDFIFLSVSKSRKKFNENMTGPLSCFSFDALRSHGGTLYGPNETVWCDSCPHVRDTCNFFYDYMVITPDQINGVPIPSKFPLKSGAIRAAKAFNSFIHSFGTPFYFYVINVTTREQDWDKGTSYIPEFKVVRQTTEQEREICRTVAKRIEDHLRRIRSFPEDH